MRMLLICGWGVCLFSQPLPDEIIFQAAGGDSVRAVCRTFREGWHAETFHKSGGLWVPLSRDTFYVDTLRRLTRYVQYAVQSGDAVPAARWRLDYPQPDLATCTIELYNDPPGTFVPQQRLYLWGTANRWDSMLRGWVGLLGLGWSLYEGALLSPYPALSENDLWGDSLLIEEYLPDVQLFVATGGYVRYSGSTCDTLLIYALQNGQRISQGWRLLCAGGNDTLLYSRDTACTASTCTAEERFLSYDAGGRLVIDSVMVRTYTTQGQIIGSISLPRRYVWDTGNRLIQAIYPGGEYRLTYGGQVVALHMPGWDQHRNFSQCPAGAAVQIYDLQMRLLWTGEVAGDGSFSPPEALPPGMYILRCGEWSVRAIRLLP